MTSWVGAQSQVNWAKRAKICTHCDIKHREPQTQNKKIYFEPKLEDMPNPYMVWTPLQLNRLASYGQNSLSDIVAHHFFVKLCNTIPRHPIELQSCSNPVRIQQAL